LWVATAGGVLSWNYREGSSYLRYGPTHGLAGALVSCLTLDRDQQPWVGYAEGGLSYFDGQQWHGYEHLRDEPVCAIAGALQRGGIWVATGRGVYYISGPENGSYKAPVRLVAEDADAAQNARALLDDGDGVLLGNFWGLFRLTPDPGTLPQKLSETILDCTALTRDVEGQVWAATAEQVYHLSQLENPYPDGNWPFYMRIRGLAAGRERILVLLTDESTSVIAQLARNGPGWNWSEMLACPSQVGVIRAIASNLSETQFWIGTDNEVWRLDTRGTNPSWSGPVLSPHPHDVLSNLARGIAPEPGGDNVWVGTNRQLLKIAPDGTILDNADAYEVRSLCLATGPDTPEMPSTVWALMWPPSLFGVSPTLRRGLLVPELGLPITLAAGIDNMLYLLSTSGLWKMGDPPSPLLKRVPPYVVQVLTQTPDDEKTWWAATVRGLYRWHQGQSNWILESGGLNAPPPTAICALRVDPAGILWAAGDSGLWSREQAALGEWTSHTPPPGPGRPLVPPITAIALGDEGYIWLADTLGVVRYNPRTGAFPERYTPWDSGLCSRQVTGMVEHNGCLWIASEAGISWYML
jgi:ligand-binding sensor domain-containing protein